LTESFPSNESEPGAQKRRSTRIVHAVPLTVAGVDALGQPFKERTSTLIISCHGCKYQSKHYVPKNSYVTLEIPNPEAGRPPRTVQARVTWVQRPRTVRELFQVGTELQIPGNVWGVAFPPEDWFPYGEGVSAEAPAILDQPEPVEVPFPPAEPAEAPKIAPTAPPPLPPQPTAPSAAQPVVTAPPVQVPPPPPPPSAEETARVVPFPGAESPAALTRQVARLLLEAKQQLQKSAREATATAVAEETSRLLGQLSAQIRAAAQEAVDAAAQTRIQEAIQQVQEEISEARQTGIRAVQDQWAQEAERAAKASSEHFASRLLETAESYREKLVAQIEAQLNQAVDRLQSFEGRFVSAAEAGQSLAEKVQNELEETAAKIREHWQERLAAEAGQALAASAEQLKAQLVDAARGAASSAQQGIVAQVAALRQSFEQLLAQGRESMSGLRADMEKEVQRSRSALAELEGTLKRSEGYGARLEAASQHVAQDALRRFEALVASQTETMNRKAEEVVAGIAGRFRPALEATEQQALEQFRARVERVLASPLTNAEQSTARLAAAQQQAEQAMNALRERINQSREQAFGEALERAQSALAQVRQDFEQSSQAAMARFREEIDAKGTDATHTTFEALYKASEWYQKKAQTSMQAMLDKALDQATSGLREKAAEFSRMFASELEHYSRSYSDHTRGLLEEGAREVVKGSRQQLAEAVETTAASFSDEVHKIAGQKAAQARSAMDAHSQQVFTAFEGRLAARIDQGVSQARQLVDAQFAVFLQNWQARFEAQQKEWLDKLGRVTNEGVEHYKGRLENVSNSWLVASVTTLGQHGQTVIDSLAQKAEDRIRQTCSEALAGLAETLRVRLLNFSADFRSAPPQDKDKKK
jgi:hypothetical protein